MITINVYRFPENDGWAMNNVYREGFNVPSL